MKEERESLQGRDEPGDRIDPEEKKARQGGPVLSDHGGRFWPF